MEVDSESKVQDLSSSVIATQYRDAAAIANAVLADVIAFLAPGKPIVDVCAYGDAQIEAAVAKVYKTKKTMEKGIAFPTCISVNERVAHYSPLRSESESLNEGDAVKIDLGVHLDGCIALVAHTVVLGASAAAPVTGPQADVIVGAHEAAEVAVRMIKPGAKNSDITAAIEKVAAAFGVNSVAAVECSQLRRFQVDGGKSIPIKRDPEAKYEDCDVEPHEVYAVEIAFTTGDGKPRDSAARTTVFRRQVEVAYQLKLAASRKLIGEVNKKFPTLPFTLRALPLEEKDARLGVTEAVKHNSLAQYPVLEEAKGAKTAHVRFTVLLLPGGTLKVTGLDAPAWAKSDKALPAELAAIRAAVPYTKPAKKAAAGAGAMEVEKS